MIETHFLCSTRLDTHCVSDSVSVRGMACLVHQAPPSQRRLFPWNGAASLCFGRPTGFEFCKEVGGAVANLISDLANDVKGPSMWVV